MLLKVWINDDAIAETHPGRELHDRSLDVRGEINNAIQDLYGDEVTMIEIVHEKDV